MGKKAQEETINQRTIINIARLWDEGEIALCGLIAANRQMERHKTPGPDEIPIEFFNELNEEVLVNI